jgi:hypothetical protein
VNSVHKLQDGTQSFSQHLFFLFPTLFVLDDAIDIYKSKACSLPGQYSTTTGGVIYRIMALRVRWYFGVTLARFFSMVSGY